MSWTRHDPAQAAPKTDQPTTTARDNPGCLESEAQTKVSGITLVDVFDKDTYRQRHLALGRASAGWQHTILQAEAARR